MTVTRRGAFATTVPATAGAEAATLPTHQTGDLLLVAELGKYTGATRPMGLTAGWTMVANGGFATGQSNGNDTGTCHFQIAAKVAASSSETNPTFTPGATAPNSWEFIAGAYIFPNGMKDAVGSIPVVSAVDTVTTSPLSASPAAFGAGAPLPGDLIVMFGITPTDTGTALGAVSLTNAGLSGGTVTGGSLVNNALGQDTGAAMAEWAGFTGAESGAYSASMTITSSTAQYGGIVLVSLREAAAAAAASLVPLNPTSQLLPILTR